MIKEDRMEKSNYKDKLDYLEIVLWPELTEAFKRGDKKYVGALHSHDERIINRSIDEDIRHIRELHVDVRLREAEELADNGDNEAALDKIVSAIGYLVILHMRTSDKVFAEE